MGLMNRAQEIVGAKTFKHSVTIEGDLILKKHSTLYAPVPGEPSLGTPHSHVFLILNNYDPLSTPTTYTVDISAQLPVGAKLIWVEMDFSSTIADREAGMLDASANYTFRGNCAVANGHAACAGFAPVSSTRTVTFYFDNASINAVYARMLWYWM